MNHTGLLKKLSFFALAAIFAVAFFGAPAFGQQVDEPSAAFTTGNIAVFQAAASAPNTTASIVELNPTTAAGNPVQTLAIPTGTASGLRFSGSATSTGYLSNNNNNTLLLFTGANSTNTTSNVNTLTARGVGTFNNAGTYNLATTYTGTSGNQTRSATSPGSTTFYIGDQGGLYTNGATAPSPSGNFRAVKSFGGIVYGGQASGTAGVAQVVTFSAPPGTATGLSGLPNNASLQDFYLIQSGSSGTTYDVLYVVSATSNTAGVISKFSRGTNGTFTANGTYTTTFGGFGLAASPVGGGGANLYVSTGLGALTANSVLRLTDTAGFNQTINIVTANNTTLYTAPTGNIVKGVAFAPSPVQPTAATVEVGGRVTQTNGRGIARVSVTLTDTLGNERTTDTNRFGFYQFTEVPAGATYVISVIHRRYRFEEPTQVRFLSENVANVNFTSYGADGLINLNQPF